MDLKGVKIMSNEQKILALENRIAILTAKGEVKNMRLIAKARRQLRALQAQN